MTSLPSHSASHTEETPSRLSDCGWPLCIYRLTTTEDCLHANPCACTHTHVHTRTYPLRNLNLRKGQHLMVLGRSTQFCLRNSPDRCMTAENTIIFLLIAFLLPFESTKDPEKHDARAHNELCCCKWIHLSLPFFYCLSVYSKLDLIAFPYPSFFSPKNVNNS